MNINSENCNKCNEDYEQLEAIAKSLETVNPEHEINISDLKSRKLDSQVTVTTAHSVAILQTSYPPSAGAFCHDLKGCISPIRDFLSKTCSRFLINAYHFFAYKASPKQVSLDFVLFQPNAGILDPANGLHYDNMLFAQIDAVYAALGRLGYKKTPVQILETGWPSKGDEDEIRASPENAKKYNGNLLKMIGEKRGTPAKSNVDLNILKTKTLF